ncbi:MAG: PaaI family thioesterase [Sphingobacteriales bacterium]|nr:MAG: PaaI family thioesterase [Sphingobacteriales bacterium]
MNYKEIPAGGVLAYLKENYEGRPVRDSRSPAGNWLEFSLDSIEKGRAQISLLVKKDMTNPYGHIHGGMMSLVMDEVIGWAVLSLDSENNYTSLNLNVDFLYAIKEGDRLKAVAEVIRHGKKIVHVACTVLSMDDVLLGKASSNLIATGMKPVQTKPGSDING